MIERGDDADRKGPLTLRPERPDDEALLFRLFCSWASRISIARRSTMRRRRTCCASSLPANGDLSRQLPGRELRHHRARGAPIGGLIVDPGDAQEPACLVDFVLLPEQRNGGLGRAIVAAVLAEQAGLGRKVRVKVLLHNMPSRRMCAALGFVEIGQALPFIQLEWRAPLA